MQDYIRLSSGTKFKYRKPRLQDIRIEDISHGLSHTCRFTGATKKFYSVAEHSVHACDMAPKGLELACLMHDAHEAIVGDVNTVLKRLLPDYERIEMMVERMTAKKFKFPFPMDPKVKEVDRRMLVTEMNQLLYSEDARKLPYLPFDIKLPCWNPQKARQEFIKRWKLYS